MKMDELQGEIESFNALKKRAFSKLEAEVQELSAKVLTPSKNGPSPNRLSISPLFYKGFLRLLPNPLNLAMACGICDANSCVHLG